MYEPIQDDLTPAERRPTISPWGRRAAPWLAVVVAGMFGAWLALAVAGTTKAELGPLAIDAEISPSWTGETVLQVDPLGTLEFDTHTAPMRVTLSIRSVDVDQARQIFSNPAAIASIENQLADDLSSALTKAAIRTAVVAVIGAVLAGGIVLRSWRRALLAGGVAFGAIAASYVLILATFDRQAVQEPTFTGILAGAPRVIGSAEAIATDFGAYVDQLASLVGNVTRIYDVSVALPTWSPADDMIRVLSVADLHLNPAAWGIIRSVADQYDVDVIVDAGDIVDHGTAAESRYVEPIGTLGRPYLFVKGNHDSVLTVAAVAEQPNAIVLDHQPVTVAGLRFLGAPDPRFTPDQRTRGTASEDLWRATEELAERARMLPLRPDVLVFHDPTNAELFEDTAPLVLTGHGHRRRDIELHDGTLVMVQGTTGGAGLRGLQGEEPMPIQLSVLYFNPETKRMVARDDITIGGLGLSTAEISRVQFGDGRPVEEDEPVDEDVPADTDAGDGDTEDADANPPRAPSPAPTP